MNNVTYAYLNKKNEPRILGDDYLNDLYEYFEFAGEELGFEVSLTKEDFGKLFGVIYDVLMLKVDEEIVEQLIAHYLKLIIADAKDGENVDLYWFIDCMWYLCVGVQKITNTKKYNDCILFIQNKLLKTFDIKETQKEKISRKKCVKYIARF